MRLLRTTLMVTLAALLLAGCPDKKPADLPKDESTASGGATAPAPVDEAELDKLSVKTRVEPETKVEGDAPPTPADFEEEAAKKITADNFEAELEAIEEELGK